MIGAKRDSDHEFLICVAVRDLRISTTGIQVLVGVTQPQVLYRTSWISSGQLHRFDLSGKTGHLEGPDPIPVHVDFVPFEPMAARGRHELHEP